MKIHIIQHESFESPGAIAIWAEQRNHAISYAKLYQGQPLPHTSEQFDLLVILGGPQSPATTLNECPHFDAQAEMQLIRDTVAADKHVLGICLGAQLIGDALGAHFTTSPHKEIGVFPLTLTKAAAQDPLFATFPKTFLVGHWHGDMPGLTPDATILASSEGCPRQIIRYTPKVYGFQCHFEFTPEAIADMIQQCAGDLDAPTTSPYIQTATELKKNDYSVMNKLLFQFLDQFCALSG